MTNNRKIKHPKNKGETCKAKFAIISGFRINKIKGQTIATPQNSKIAAI